jgi:hypothetical protein
MTHSDFTQILNSLNGLSPQQMQRLQRELSSKIAAARPRPDAGLGSIGAMRDAADELDEIVADAMKRRQQETWRDVPVE